MHTIKPSRPRTLFWLQLLPLLGFYTLIGILGNRNYLRGDESRYLVYAHNILDGYFASDESLMFWNGPGYPLFLTPFVHGHFPLIIPRLGNALFLFLAMGYFAASLRQAGIKNRVMLLTYTMGLALFFHGPLLDMLMSESLCVFLICGAMYHFFRLLSGPGMNYMHLAATALHLGYLVWTKVFFGYALEISFILALGLWIFIKLSRTVNARYIGNTGPRALGDPDNTRLLRATGYSALVCGLALVFCIPYLIYTWSQTGKIHFWGNSGGLQLYCLTVPEKELTGDWLNFDMVRDYPDFFPVQAPFFAEMAKLDFLKRDEAFKKAAFDNIKAHPTKFFRNWRSNINRLIFGFPVSPYPGADLELTTGNRSLAYCAPFIFFFLILIPGWLGRKAIPLGAHIGLIFAIISFGGLSLLSGIPRQVFPILPLIGFWIMLAIDRTLLWKPGQWGVKPLL